LSKPEQPDCEAKTFQPDVRHVNDLVFEVGSSRKDGKPYLCDLSKHGGLGQCECHDWTGRVWPRIKDGLKSYDYPHAERHNCKHIHAAMLWLAREVIKRRT